MTLCQLPDMVMQILLRAEKTASNMITRHDIVSTAWHGNEDFVASFLCEAPPPTLIKKGLKKIHVFRVATRS